MHSNNVLPRQGFLRWNWMVISVLLLAVGLMLPAMGEGLGPEHIAKIRTVTSAKISPDGEHVAFTLSVPRTVGEGKDGRAWGELHLIRVKDGHQIPFVSGEVNVSSVAWTPDGRSISFLAKRGEDKQTSLYVIAADGGEAKRALALSSSVLIYRWSPDGSKVAAIALEPEDEEVKKLKEKGFSQEVVEEDWRHRRLYIAEPSADLQKDLEPLTVDGSVFDMEWAPSGDRLALAVAPTPLTDDGYMSKHVVVSDAQSGQILARLSNSGKLGEISWSPDGRHIAMVSGVDINDPAAASLLVAPAAGGSPRDLFAGDEGGVSHIAWLPSNKLLFVADRGVWSHLQSVSPDGSGRKQLLDGNNGPAITSLSVSEDGHRAAFVASTPEHPAEVFLVDVGKDDARRLTNSNPWLEEMELAKQEVVEFKARDGLDLEGILIRPLKEVAGQRYPLILYVHGGPESHHKNGWLTSYSGLGQMAAAREMAVFHTNYRGSTGRGVEFAKSSQADPAGKEFDDLVDAVDHLIATGLVDKDKVACTGGSYGGYATGWMATRYTDRFAAGVMFVGISDKISKVGTTDIPEEEYLVHARKRPWDDWKFFLERSPIYHAGQGKTPLLILHGKDDPRVNVGQSRELYRHLKLRGSAPVRLVFYPGEGHGNRRAASRLDYSLRSLRWMEHYLKGPGGEAPPYQLDYEAVLEAVKE